MDTEHVKWWESLGAAGLAITLAAAPAWGQIVGPASDVVRNGAATAKQTAKDATDTAEKTAKEVKDTARDSTKAARDTAKDAADKGRDTAREATRGARDTARDATKGARDTAREATEGARETARDAARGARDTTDKARDSVRDAREGVRDTTRDARDTARDAGEAARDGVRDARDTVRETAKDVREGVRDTAREVREGVRDVRQTFRAESTRSADFGIWFNRSSDRGLVISDLGTSGAITKVGLREGDVIVSVNGTRVKAESDFVRTLFADDLRNTRVKVIVMRRGSEEVVYIQPSVFIEEMHAHHHDPLETFGIVLDDRYSDRIVVWKVLPRTPAFYAGFRSGDVITTFRGNRVGSPTEFVQIIGKTDPGTIAVEVNRGDARRSLEVDYRGRTETRTVLRPNFDENAERREERREERQDDLRDLREERREDAKDRRDDAKDRREDPAVKPRPTQPYQPSQPDRSRGGIFRRR